MAPTKVLLDSDDESHANNNGSSSEKSWERKDENVITVNRKFARQYNEKKGQEELAKKRKYDNSFDERNLGIDNDGNSSSSSSSEDEDEEAEMLTPVLDVAIHRVINQVRKKDNSIYDPKIKFFEENDEDESDSGEEADKKTRKKYKKMTYKDVVRIQAMEKMNADASGDEDDESGEENEPAPHKLAYDEEQKKIRAAFLGDDEENDSGDDDILLVKKKQTGRTMDDKEYQEALRREIDNVGVENQSVENNGSEKDNKLDVNGEQVIDPDAFLKDFLINRRWIDNVNYGEGSDDDKEGNGSGDEEVSMKKPKTDLDEQVSEDEDFVDKMDAFESKYNFRFEEQQNSSDQNLASGQIVGYARGTSVAHFDSYRKADDKRKRARESRKERKQEARRVKEEELRRLKNARRNELQGRLNKIMAVSGITTKKDDRPERKNADSMKSVVDKEGVDEKALFRLLEGDFDPDQFSKKMEELMYNEDYYNQEDDEWKTEEDVKKALVKDGEVDPNLMEYVYDDDGNNENDANHGLNSTDNEYEEDVEDQVYDMEEENDELTNDFSTKAKAKIQEELYKLDYEDMIGDLPCRFKYKQVETNDYGLSTAEILIAEDQKLKQYVSLKKMVPYSEQGEYHVTARYRKKFRDAIREDYEMCNEKEKSAANNAANDAIEENPNSIV
eukprot:CAMPEP_0113302700 /NCGR_PEP_ID=MMETSP0010_2-20120614/3415_1 /TAXON_ID=216773 ORGANISM="Corethron hystrix, Strain 308" /NCGR_SAMPLE_ID=MMETSP0010_2 /ASSEMBLY_ACC=CAM_ASM_000155 /LENGTH=671 /DNA_ID=CAMNT_0000156557 /DNA_START=156 /DNA_END=2167 /DNA_ORIENTATION=- /assembly_acc=CAM_ASM_000155